ncbi:MAG TPA: ABC transporter ATP-binding protein, partial [Thermomicrobiales bacterium]|nr:ABC transporter ATP-binding protein [Thermomicrobiales bacterium]
MIGGVDPDDLLGKAYDPRVARRLFAFVDPYRRRAVGALLLIAVGTVSDLLLPKLFSMAVDEVSQARRLSVLNLLGVAFLITLCVRFLANWGEFYQISWLGNRIVFDIRNRMFRHLQTLNVGYVDRRGVGSIMSRIQNDVGVINDFFSDAVAGVFGSSLILAGIVILMLWTNWRLALLSFAVLPVMALFMRFWRERAIATYRATRRTIAIVNANLAESIAGIRVAQAFTREPENIRHFERLSRDNLDASIDAARLSSLLFPIVSLIGAVATATTVYVGGKLVLAQSLTLGELVLFVALIDRFFEPIRDLSQQYTVLQAAMVAGERIFEVLDFEPDVRDKPGAGPLPPIVGRIDYNHVRFGYGPTEILHDVDLHIDPGETVALVGETGAGKTSMVNLLLRFADVWSGSIAIDRHDVRDVTQTSLRSQLGVVLQDTFLFGGTVRDNIAFARPEASQAEIEWAARE